MCLHRLFRSDVQRTTDQRDRSLFADVLGRHARIGSGVTRMAFRAIASNHHQGMRNHLVHNFLRIGENYHLMTF